MKYLRGERPFYEIVKLLGEGATGRVFKALRWNQPRDQSQVVALKILKSEDQIHFLRQEFARLKKVKSSHCVKLYAWENLEMGKAIVLEHLEGMTLYRLAQLVDLSSEEIQEVVAQVQKGLRDLVEFDLFHGDLSPKNIFVTTQGIIKLIDFGATYSATEVFTNPKYMAPELQWSRDPNLKSDLYSLGLIEQQLRQKSWAANVENLSEKKCSQLSSFPEKRKLYRWKSSEQRRKKLKKTLRRAQSLLDKRERTQQMPQLNRKSSLWLSVGLFLGLLCFSFLPRTNLKAPMASAIDIRVGDWAEVSINGLPFFYAPKKMTGLRPGHYTIRWKKGGSMQQKKVQLKAGELFLLKLDTREL